MYIDSWDSEKLQAEIKRRRGDVDSSLTEEEERAAAEEIRMLTQEIKDVTRGGAHTMWPHLQHIYKTRVRAYREAVNQFIEGYKEGLAEKPEEETPSSTTAAPPKKTGDNEASN
jgi:hypothetical protein